MRNSKRDARRVGGILVSTINGTIPSGAYTPVPLNGVGWDSGGVVVPGASARLLVTEAGLWSVTGWIQFGANGTGRRIGQIPHTNASGASVEPGTVSLGETDVPAVSAAGQTTVTMSGITLAQPGEWFLLQGFQDSGVSLSIGGRLAAALIG